MNLNQLLEYRNMSQYRLAKLSGVPQSTLSDISSNKTDMSKCEAFTLYKIAKALGITVEDIFIKEIDLVDHQDFEVYKSNVCHLYKSLGYEKFLSEMYTNELIDSYYENKQFAKAFYLLGFCDYVSRINKVNINHSYDDIRNKSLLNRIYPEGAITLNKVFNNQKYTKLALKKSIPEIRRFNIIEGEIDNVY